MRIYFWNVDELSKKLSKGFVKDNDALKHLIAYLIITGSYISLPNVDTENTAGMGFVIVSLVSRVFESLLCIYGFIQLYKTNRSGDDRQFFLRLAALSLPITVRIYVTLLLIVSISGLVLGVSSLDFVSWISETIGWNYINDYPMISKGISNMLLSLFCMAWYFTKMNKHILSVSMR